MYPNYEMAVGQAKLIVYNKLRKVPEDCLTGFDLFVRGLHQRLWGQKAHLK